MREKILSVEDLSNAIGVNAIFVNEIGSFEFKFIEFSELDEIIKEAYIK